MATAVTTPVGHCLLCTGMSELGVSGVPWFPQILADQLKERPLMTSDIRVGRRGLR